MEKFLIIEFYDKGDGIELKYETDGFLEHEIYGLLKMFEHAFQKGSKES